MKKFWQDKLDKIADNIIQSICSPQSFIFIISIILGTCYHQNIIDTITNTQARLLLQKKRMNSFEKQIMEVWIATQGLTFLFNSHEKERQNSKKTKASNKGNQNDKKIQASNKEMQNNEKTKNNTTLEDKIIIVNSEKIKEAYKHWNALKANWIANFSTNYEYVSAFQLEKTEKYCLNKKELLTDLQHQFKCRIDKMFKEEFFNKLGNCYKNYYLKNKSCKTTLPSPQMTNELNNTINSFYLQISSLK